ncbi:MAG: vanadium-dependent haloperoxidase [Leeuwenhoekiella sp.]
MKTPFLISLSLIFSLSIYKPVFSQQNHNLVRFKVTNIPTGKNNIAYKWGAMALQATANDTEKFKPRPTITSRYLGLIFTAAFDAWSRYDANATPVYLQNVNRQTQSESTLSNKEIAISYAAFGTMKEYYYSDTELFSEFMKELGLDPENSSHDPNTPEGIGNLAAEAVIEARRHDGANQYGQEKDSEGKPYFNYTGYKPVNSPDENIDPNRWQPKYFSDGKGGSFAPECLTPYWDKVKPIGLTSADQFRPGPPPKVGSAQMAEEVKEVMELQANMTDKQKALVEFMRDGPQSVQQAGHWLNFAQAVSERDNHTLDEDVKMYFLCQITAMDAFIACWDAKMFYDSPRPYALVHKYYEDQIITAWGGPDKGLVKMKGQEWRPYSPDVFLCPPFPGYVSGHSSISGACGEALKLFTGSDKFGRSVELIAGSMTEPDHLGKTVTIEFPTFTESANMAGFSRVLGGYHIQADNLEGLELGRKVAREDYQFYLKHINSASEK